ncbi:MAG: ATP phosphoribosyltransferase regulatory subunit [Gammaproteobacteria bacterium]|nr:ATP phosphoribosyltransferase regulatory subunit [Gammaproteobacteria bacterium]
MSVSDRWLLPEGIEELLPDEAHRVEEIRSALFGLYRGWGYELVVTPLIEHLESLTVGIGGDLESHTFRLVDQVSGRMLGVRSDITPQVARIDAHRLNRKGPARLCYWGPVLLTRARELGGNRSPIQVGAELYGHRGYESDLEILRLMIESLRIAGQRQPYLDLGHVGVFKALTKQAELTARQEELLFDALQRKAKPEMKELLAEVKDAKVAAMLASLVDLNGSDEVLAQARQALAGAVPAVQEALSDLEQIVKALRHRYSEMNIHIDLAELRGYSYHTGVVFAAYAKGYGQSVAQGGRYDAVGAVFGRARPATGFSLDLRGLLALNGGQTKPAGGIFAPVAEDAQLRKMIHDLRAQGERVICELPGQEGGPADCGCDRVLVNTGGAWTVQGV